MRRNELISRDKSEILTVNWNITLVQSNSRSFSDDFGRVRGVPTSVIIKMMPRILYGCSYSPSNINPTSNNPNRARIRRDDTRDEYIPGDNEG